MTEAITNSDGSNKPMNEHVKECYTSLLQALTQPTAEEVVKALSEELEETVYCKNNVFYDSKDDLFLWKDNDGEIVLYDTFLHKPHTYELIGRFYGGLK